MESPSTCFVCGPAHPNGLRIQFVHGTDQAVQARWTPGRTWEGFPGIIHGGVVCTILDEAMAKAIAARGCRALTAEMKVRFLRPVRSGQEVTIRGWVLDHLKRRIRTEASVTGADGGELAHASGTFLVSTVTRPVAETGAGLR
jgi:uncharacterized protein (TIGR00369 family)